MSLWVPVALAVIGLTIGATVTYANWLSNAGTGSHTYRAARERAAAEAEAEASKWITQLHETKLHRSELLVPIGERRSPDLAALTRTLDGTGWLPMLPDDPPPADTGALPVATCELGMPTEKYVDELFDLAEKHIQEVTR